MFFVSVSKVLAGGGVMLAVAACGNGDDDGGPSNGLGGQGAGGATGAGGVTAAAGTGGTGGNVATGGNSAHGYQPQRVGYVELIDETSWAQANAAIFNKGEVPPAELLAEQGDCRIYTHPAPGLCTPPCTTGFCLAGNVCESWPEQASAGPITVTGLTQQLSFVAGPYGYTPQPSPGSDDLFTPGATITATAVGEVTEGFSLTARGVAPLVASFPTTLVIEDGVDKQIDWTAASDGRIQLALRVGWHGAAYEALLLCETEDDGSLTIPGSLITQFPQPSSGMEQHYSWLARFTRDVVQTSAGPLELLVASRVIILQISHL